MGFMVIGARGVVGDVEEFIRLLRAEAEKVGLQVQAFDADMVFGEDHILSALEHAERAFHRGSNVASDLMVEVLVYAAGERQISRAMEKMGLKEGAERLVLLAVDEGDVDALLAEVSLVRDDSLVEGNPDHLHAYGITETELKTVPPEKAMDLVLERVALVDILR